MQRPFSRTCTGLHKHLTISSSFLQAFSVFPRIFLRVNIGSLDCRQFGEDKEHELRKTKSSESSLRANSLLGQLREDWGGGG